MPTELSRPTIPKGVSLVVLHIFLNLRNSVLRILFNVAAFNAISVSGHVIPGISCLSMNFMSLHHITRNGAINSEWSCSSVSCTYSHITVLNVFQLCSNIIFS